MLKCESDRLDRVRRTDGVVFLLPGFDQGRENVEAVTVRSTRECVH